jgi:hypothetical protein
LSLLKRVNCVIAIGILPLVRLVCGLTDRPLTLPVFDISELYPVSRNAHQALRFVRPAHLRLGELFGPPTF